ncbi:AAA family ATPase [Gluconobacter sp. LMG 31484]|uniref:Chromosome partition protein Smc n=1 Tax=Gluconobacter vitians TaxID=2728102 RepID=A0ABR9Y1U1_9PROT|nr:AAA family ATPase [Gluconobacter vitians]MBF0857913.1 AAA family ATPase [Gluconobacter vitians]
MSSRATTIDRLSIGGFKSFADEVRLDILPGLTGIIGPNGCGKSNVVEGLRWAMGETSARALRGGELDDLIFAGTGARSARNIAQVTLHLSNAAGLAPSPFQDADELEISRRAERGSGSEYRINGRVMRARDVQTLFADLASGARSSAIISQNRVGQLIAAKPEERRLLLEEAAGITGLHARRHDAELKLRQTETNLSRAEDLRLQLEERLASLEGQTVQARKYREISEKIRTTETELHALLHARANLAVQRSRDDLAKAREDLKKAEQAAEAAAIAEFEARKAAPDAREETDRLRSALERLKVQFETLRQDLERARQAESETRARLEQAQGDLARSEASLAADRAAHTAATEECSALEAEAAALPAQRSAGAAECDRLAALEKDQASAFEEAIRLRDAEAIRRDAVMEGLDALTIRLDAEVGALEALTAEITALDQATPGSDTLSTLRQNVAATQAQSETASRREQDCASALQDARLKAELDGRALTEGKNRLETLQAAEADLDRRLQTTESQIRQDRTTRETAQTALLSEQARTGLETTRNTAAQALNEAQVHEEQARQEQERLGTLWLESRAAAEEGTQRQKALLRTVEQNRYALEQARQKAASAAAAEAEARTALMPEQTVQEAVSAVARIEDRLNGLQDALTKAEASLTERREQENQACSALLELETLILRTQGECEGLEQSLNAVAAQPDPLEDALDLPADMARAVAAVLADGLDASLAPDTTPADRRWRTLDRLGVTELPSCRALSTLIEAPEALMRCLDAAFLLEDESAGTRLQKALQPGQVLVCRSGALWRWDGFTRSADAPDAGAVRLEQRRRLTDARALLQSHEASQPALSENHASASRAREQAEAALAALRRDRATLEPHLAEARTVASRLEQKAALVRTQWEQVTQRRQEADEALTLAQTAATQAEAELAAHPAPDALQARATACAEDAENARNALRAVSTQLQEARSIADTAVRALDQAILRHDAARSRLQDLDDGLARLEDERARLAAQRVSLQQQNNRPDMTALTAAAQASQDVLDAAGSTADAASHTARESREQAARLLRELQALDQAAATAQARRSALEPRRADLQALVGRLREDHAKRRAELAERPEPAVLEQAVLDAAGPLQQTRHLLEEARTESSRLSLEEVRLTGALTAVRARLETLASRIATEEASLAQLRTRHDVLQESFQTASALPAELERKLAGHDQTLTEAQNAYDAARARDEAAGVAGLEAQEQRRNADLALAAGREAIARLTERAEQAVAARERLLADSEPPQGSAQGGAYPSDLSEQAETSTRRRLSRLTREREELGAVNLRAEAEFEEARETAETIAREHAELTAAINRLRGGIGTINREGRERLLAVFTEVDRHFQSLFARMFGGGRAHLGMVGSDDPLEAGLEIFAQPPGKKLSTLSLLSGGEQALTALSLIFATFRCNPAPICVLDEVDAPLDDANVERFCSLLSDMTKEAGTRFLVVTHHQLTMAHMDRLYGVTMQERGVSRVLSVDLGHATALVDG